VTKRLPAILLSVGHASVDVYQGIVPALIPFLVLDRGYGFADVSGFVLAATIVSAAAQPLFGMLTDRWSLRFLIPLSMAIAGIGTALVGVVDSYPATLIVIAVSGLGVAAYHPQAARTARVLTGGGHVAMSWFSLGGQIGFVLAPVIAVPVLTWGGLAATPWLAVPAVIGILTTLPYLSARGSARKRPEVQGTNDWPQFRWLTAVIILRSFIFIGLSGFVGIYAADRTGGGSLAAGAAVFALYAGGAVGTVLGGRLAGRWGRVRVLRWSYIVSAVGVAGIVAVPGSVVYGLIVVTAVALSAPFSLHITLGQDYLSTRPGTASGVTLGLAVSAGGLFAPVLGAMADATSLRAALGLLVLIGVVTCVVTRPLVEPTAVIPEPQTEGVPANG